MYRDNRDPEVLGKAIMANMAAARQRGEESTAAEIADRVDKGVAGNELCHPAYLNGKAHLRLTPEVVEGAR